MWTAVEALLDELVGAGLAAGCALAVRGPDGLRYAAARGMAELAPRPRPARVDTPFDLASLTKVLCGAPLAMALVGQGRLDLDAPLTALLPDAPIGVTARHCLLHTTGLPAWAPLYAEVVSEGATWGSAETRARVLAAARRSPLQHEPGSTAIYSDLGFLLLCAALEAVGGARVDRLWDRLVGAPSGADLRWGWPGAAATELCPVRGAVVTGQVHDLNAAVLGGLSTHAGLFGSADAVADLAAWQLRAWAGDTDAGLDPGVVRQFWSAKGPGSHRLGWDGVTPGGCSAGDRWPLDGVGHLGFTGCALWVSPRQGVVAALLANRVHPLVEGGSVPGALMSPRYAAFRAIRPRVFTAVVEALDAAGAWRPGA